MKIYFGDGNGKAQHPKKVYVGDENGIARLVKRAYVGDTDELAHQIWPYAVLPRAYQQVEYILNPNHTEYIDTGVKPNSDTRCILEFVFIWPTFGTIPDSYLFGVDNTFYENRYVVGLYGTVARPDTVTIAGVFGTSNAIPHTSITSGHKHILDFNRSGGYFYLDNVQIGSSVATFSTLNDNLLLFGANYSELEILDLDMKVYHFQMYQGSTIIRDMYPCYLKSDTQTVGMYDVVNDVFYGNAGTGIFYKGPDV